MRYLPLLLGLFLATVATTHSNGQRRIKDSVLYMPLVTVSYAGQIPGGDLDARYGFNSSIGGSVLMKNKQNFLYGFQGNFIFGDRIREDTILNGLKTATGEIISTSGQFARVLAFQRGLTLSAQVGKIFPVFGPNPNSGIMVRIGAGYLQHKIRYEVRDVEVPQLSEENAKGYDRLTSGFMLNQFVGYQYLGNSRFANFMIGLEFYQGFTRGRRSWQWDSNTAQDEPRIDLLSGIRVGWTAPIYKREPKEFYID